MQKRGQATLFIILGIVLLIAIALIFFLRGNIDFGLTGGGNVNSQLAPIREHIEECIDTVAPPGIKTLALQGGTLTPNSFTLYNGTNVQYLCYKEPSTPTCIQKILTRQDMENELNDYIRFQLAQCIDLDQFDTRRIDVTTGILTIDTNINDNNIQVNLDYPITLTSTEETATISDFSSIIRLPLGKLHDVSIEIINSETEFGFFDNIDYMVQNQGSIFVERHTPYPDEVYVLYPRDTSIEFQVAVQGEDTL